MNPLELGLWLKCNELFALANNELALPPTPLLLRFFSPFPPPSPELRPGGLPFPDRFSLLPPSSAVFGLLAVFGLVERASGTTESAPPSLGGDPELPNILFSRPPWEEKLLRLLPATLLIYSLLSREETC